MSKDYKKMWAALEIIEIIEGDWFLRDTMKSLENDKGYNIKTEEIEILKAGKVRLGDGFLKLKKGDKIIIQKAEK